MRPKLNRDSRYTSVPYMLVNFLFSMIKYVDKNNLKEEECISVPIMAEKLWKLEPRVAHHIVFPVKTQNIRNAHALYIFS